MAPGARGPEVRSDRWARLRIVDWSSTTVWRSSRDLVVVNGLIVIAGFLIVEALSFSGVGLLMVSEVDLLTWAAAPRAGGSDASVGKGTEFLF